MDSSPSNSESPDEFRLLRAEAIGAYSDLEYDLEAVFSLALGDDRQLANLILSRIAGFRTRLDIVEAVLRRHFRGRSTKMLSSLVRELGVVNTTRNRIVHWSLCYRISTGNGDWNASSFWREGAVPILLNPTLDKDGVPPLDADALRDFLRRIDFLTQVIRAVRRHATAAGSGTKETSLHELLSSKVACPPDPKGPLAHYWPKG